MQSTDPASVEGGHAPPPARVLAAVVTFRRPEQLAATLRAIGAQTRPPDHLFVVDNGGQPELETLARDALPTLSWSYHAMPENLGPAGGIAWAMQQAIAQDATWLWLIDDDDPPWIDDQLARELMFAEQNLHADPNLAGVGCAGGRFDLGRAVVQRVPDGELKGSVAVSHVGGGQFPLYRVEALRAVGTFDPRMFWGFEELEFGLRLRATGRTLRVHGELWAWRREGLGRLGRMPRIDTRIGPTSWRRFYSFRNLLYILASNGHFWTAMWVAVVRGVGKPLANLPLAPRLSARALRWNLRAIREAFTGRMGRTLDPADLPVD